jgi:hypothetical protein
VHLQKFAYSDREWELVTQALKRIRVDADRATMPSRDEPLRASLEAFAQSYLEARQYVLSLKSREEILEPMRAYIKSLLDRLEHPRVKSLIAFGTDDATEINRMVDSCINGDEIKKALDLDYHNQINKLYDLDLRCAEACKYKIQSNLPKVGERAQHHFQEHQAFFERLVTIHTELGGYAGGAEDGPTVTFLLAAAEPVLRAETPTKEACRSWLRRRMTKSRQRRGEN